MTMKITGADVRPMPGLTPAGASREKTADAPAREADSAAREYQVSNSARKMADLEARALKSSGIDEAKVEALRLAIERGEYHIDSKTIADQLLRLDWQIGKASGRIG